MSAEKVRKKQIRDPPERRSQQTGEVPSGLREYTFGVAQGLEPFFAMVGTDAACADAAEGQVLNGEVQNRVVDCDIAARGALENPAADLAVSAKEIERQRTRPRVHIGKRVIDAMVGNDRQDGSENLVLKDRHLGCGIEDQGGRQCSFAIGVGVDRWANLNDACAFLPCVLDQRRKPGVVLGIDDRSVGRIRRAVSISRCTASW